MRIILSRKGFDSAAGGYANPILPDGTLLSLPIPDSDTKTAYSELSYNDKSYFELMSELSGDYLKEDGKKIDFNKKTTCHLDPDLRRNTIERMDD